MSPDESATENQPPKRYYAGQTNPDEPYFVWEVQRRAYDFPGKLYPWYEVKSDGDNWSDEPGDWFDIKE